MIKVSAPGKVHLIGEHSVVYGKPAIISAVGLRIIIEAEKSDSVSFSDNKNEGKFEYDLDETIKFSEEIDALWEKCSKKSDFSELFSHFKGKAYNFKKVGIGKALRELAAPGGISMKISGQIPLGSGLGSSAALAVCFAKAVSETYSLNAPIEKINEIAYSIEKLIHGTPSGGDNTTCAYGGLVWFEKSNPDITRSLKDEVPYELENFVLVYTKKPEKTTGELVSMVRETKPELRDKRINALGEATHEMLKALKERDFKKVKELINFAWDNLSAMGLSIPEADGLISKVRKIGGAAKLCGACGGGIMLCYHEDQEKLAEIIKKEGFEPMKVELNVEGARVEE